MTDQENRIKLAEAMGWDREGHDFGSDTWIKGKALANTLCLVTENELPDPFTDANDDYAVLCHFREGKDWREFRAYLVIEPTECDGFNYQIGDYARAALKVIE